MLHGRAPDNIVFSPDGRTAYQRGYKLRVYRRNKNGALTLLPQPFGILRGPVDEIAVMPDGRHVYVKGHVFVEADRMTVTRAYQVAR